MQGEKELKPKLFYSKSIVDMIPETNFYFKLKELLDWTFVRKELSDHYAKAGRPSLDPIVFFKLNLVGCLENLVTDRDLIRKCALRLDVLYFLNYDIDESLPWHSTISRTRQQMPVEIFEKLFEHMFVQCIESGMVLSGDVAVDSAYIKANASLESLEERKQVDLLNYLAKVRESNKSEDSREEKEFKKRDSIEKRPASKRSNKDFYSRTDTDAKIARKSGTPTDLYFGAVVATDTENHLICDAFAGHADKHDSRHLMESAQASQKRYKQVERKIENIVADGAFTSGPNLIALENLDIESYMPAPSNFKKERKNFTYDEVKDEWECRNGKKLKFKQISDSGNGKLSKDYKTQTSDCKNCPFKDECIPKQPTKKISVSIHSQRYKQLDQRMQTKTGKRLMRKRKSSVEPVLGQLKHQLGIRKIFTKGIKNANKKMLMAAITHNMKKWLKQLAKSPSIAKSGALKRYKKSLNKLFSKIYNTMPNYSPRFNI